MSERTETAPMDPAVAAFRAHGEARRVAAELLSQPLAVMPEALRLYHAIAMRQTDGPSVLKNIEPRGVAVDLGRPLEGGSRATVRDNVAIIRVLGPIFPRANMMTEYSGATSLRELGFDLRAARADERVEAVLIEYDTPGGVAFGVGEMAAEIRALNEIKPVTAYISGQGASAGYWLGCAAGEIVVDPSAVVGCIGVVQGHYVQVQPDQSGEMLIEVVSSNAPNKRPDPRSEEGLKVIRGSLDALENVFVDTVAGYRGVTREKVMKDFGAGGVLVGAEAVAVGLADRLGDFESTLRAVSEAARARSDETAGPAADRLSLENDAMADQNSGAITAASVASGLSLAALTEHNPALVAQIGEAAVASAVGGTGPHAATVAGHVDAAVKTERTRIVDILTLDKTGPAATSAAGKAIASGSSPADYAFELVKTGEAGRRQALADEAAGDPSGLGDAPAAGAPGVKVPEGADPVLADKWRKDAAAREEFAGDFDAFAAFEAANSTGKVRLGKAR